MRMRRPWRGLLGSLLSETFKLSPDPLSVEEGARHPEPYMNHSGRKAGAVMPTPEEV
jgi:hypothetical protein